MVHFFLRKWTTFFWESGPLFRRMLQHVPIVQIEIPFHFPFHFLKLNNWVYMSFPETEQCPFLNLNIYVLSLSLSVMNSVLTELLCPFPFPFPFPFSKLNYFPFPFPFPFPKSEQFMGKGKGKGKGRLDLNNSKYDKIILNIYLFESEDTSCNILL